MNYLQTLECYIFACNFSFHWMLFCSLSCRSLYSRYKVPIYSNTGLWKYKVTIPIANNGAQMTTTDGRRPYYTSKGQVSCESEYSTYPLAGIDKFFRKFMMLCRYSIVLGLGLHLLHSKLHAAHMRIEECKCTWMPSEDEKPSFDLVSSTFPFYHLLTIPSAV